MKKPQLFLLHFAGGNKYSYVPMAPYLNEFEVIPLELPGRGSRINENLIHNFDLAARDFFNQIKELQSSSCFMIYGHSMGAYLALRVTNMLQREYVAPAYLFVSGNAGPGIRGNMLRHLLNQDEFIAEVKKLGGLSEEFLMNEDLLDFYLPILRADFSIAEQNNLTNEPPVYCPLYALMGSLEEKVDEITNWGRFTRSRFEYKILEGDHFFIHQHPREIAGIIKEKYDFITFLQHQQME